MSYTPTSWSTGDTITASAMNKIENGIANAGGGILFDIGVEDGVLDKTWMEIYTALSSNKIARIVQTGESLVGIDYVAATLFDGDYYNVYIVGSGGSWYRAASNNGYPEFYED